jgi:ATP-binding cassette subfamily B multidrug efflux pump
LRSQFGYVPQRSFLFSASIRDNIAFGTDTLTEDDIQRLVKAASLEQDFKLFPQGWETVVGERGITISGGQKQRVSIARALAIEPPVLLLDDPLSAVDADTEERILQEILSDIKGRTALIVSHRISTLKHCDDIIVLENGRITQQGHHDSLKDQEGYYQNIFHIQQVEAESLGGVQ